MNIICILIPGLHGQHKTDGTNQTFFFCRNADGQNGSPRRIGGPRASNSGHVPAREFQRGPDHTGAKLYWKKPYGKWWSRQAFQIIFYDISTIIPIAYFGKPKKQWRIRLEVWSRSMYPISQRERRNMKNKSQP